MRSAILALRAEARLQAGGLLDLVGPNLCEVCSGRVPRPHSLCERCRPSLRPAGGVRDPVPCIAAFRYQGDVARRTVARFKYAGARRLAVPLAEAMAAAWRSAGLSDRVLLVPVPIAADRLRLRGYNQAQLLAIHLAEELRLPVLELLCRVRATRSQTLLGPAGRERNLAGAFAVGRATPYLPIVLVDDVRTTGATLATCRRVLNDAGHAVAGSITAFWTPPDGHRARRVAAPKRDETCSVRS